MKYRDCLRKTLESWLDLGVNATWSTLELAITNAKRVESGLNPLDASKECTIASSIIIYIDIAIHSYKRYGYKSMAF